MNQVILVSASWISYNSKIINKFNSLSKDFPEIKFNYLDFDLNKQEITFPVKLLPTWWLYIKGQEKILEGDILIKPLRFAIRNLINSEIL